MTCGLQKPKYRDIPIWGKLVVYDKPEDAVGALMDDEVKGRYVRLVKVATNQELRRLLEPGQELCRPDAALYLRVDVTCPLYFLRWEETEPEFVMEIVPLLPQSGTRQTMIDILNPDPDGRSHPVVGRVGTRRKTRAGDVGICAR